MHSGTRNENTHSVCVCMRNGFVKWNAEAFCCFVIWWCFCCWCDFFLRLFHFILSVLCSKLEYFALCMIFSLREFSSVFCIHNLFTFFSFWQQISSDLFVPTRSLSISLPVMFVFSRHYFMAVAAVFIYNVYLFVFFCTCVY